MPHPPHLLFSVEQPPYPVVSTIQVNTASGLLTNQRRSQLRRAMPRWIGVKPPGPSTPFPPIQVNIASDLLRRHYIPTRRFPLQGWEGWGAIDALSGFGLLDQYKVGTTSQSLGFNTNNEKIGVPFTQLSGTLAYVVVGLRKSGTPVDNVVVEIRSDTSGTPGALLATAAPLPGASVFTDEAAFTFTFDASVPLKSTSTYWLTLSRSGALDNANFFIVPSYASPVNRYSTFTSGAWLGGLATADFQVGYQATDGSHSFYGYKRNLGPFPPRVIDPLPSQQQQQVIVKSLPQAVVRRQQAQQRAPKSLLFPPQALAQPPPAPYAVRVSVTRTRPRHTMSLLPTTIVATAVATFAGPLVHTVTLRPRRTHSTLSAPVVLQTFASGKAVLARARPRHTTRYLSPPTVVRVPSVEQREQTISVALARLRPRRTRSSIGSPIALTVFAGPVVHLVRSKPRPTAKKLSPPTVVRVPSVEQAEQTITTKLVRVRPRPTRTVVFEPTALSVFAGPDVHLVATRPRRVIQKLSPPTVIRVPSVDQAEDTIRVQTVKTRPRPTRAALSEPTALQTFSGPRVALTRTRPGATTRTLGEPTVLQTFEGPLVSLTRIRPRRTIHALTAVTYPAVETEIRVALTRTRPRPTVRELFPPTVLQTFDGPSVSLAMARPRPTVHTLSPPTVVSVPSVEQQRRTIRVELTKTRPRPTTTTLSPPTVIVVNPPVVTTLLSSLVVEKSRSDWKRRFMLQGFRQRMVAETGSVAAAIAPGGNFDRGTIGSPVLVGDPGDPTSWNEVVTPSSSTITYDAQVLAAAGTGSAKLTTTTSAAPLVGWTSGLGVPLSDSSGRIYIRVPVVPGALMKFVTFHLGGSVVADIRTTAAGKFATADTGGVVGTSGTTIAGNTTYRVEWRLIHGPVTGSLQINLYLGDSTTLLDTVTRPGAFGASHDEIRFGLSVNSLANFTIFIDAIVAEQASFPGPFASSGSAASIALRDPFIGPRPPMVIGPLATEQQQTISTALAAVRTRAEQIRRQGHSRLSPPAVVSQAVFVGPDVTLTRIRPRPTVHALGGPEALATFAGPGVSLTRIRPRRTLALLARPAVVRTTVFDGPSVTLARIRPSRTLARLLPVPVAVPERVVEETIRVALVQPVGYRRARSRLAPPAVVVYLSLAQQTLRTRFARIRPSRTSARLIAPVVAVVSLRDQTIRVSLARTRPPGKHVKLYPPTVVAPLPTLAQQTLTTVFAVEARLLHPGVHAKLNGPQVLVIPRPGVTWGEDVAATTTEGFDDGGASVTSDDKPDTSVFGDDSAAVESVGGDIAATSVESEDKEAGT